MSKLKEFADSKIHMNEVLNFVTGRVKNTVEKGEYASYQQCFKKTLDFVSCRAPHSRALAPAFGAPVFCYVINTFRMEFDLIICSMQELS